MYADIRARTGMSLLAILVHTYRLRRVSRALATLNWQFTADEAACSTVAIPHTDEDLRIAGLSHAAE